MEGEPAIGAPLTLAAARRLAADIMRQRAFGRDVISDVMSAKRRRKADVGQRATQGFAAAARRFVEEYARVKTRSWTTTARVLGLRPNLEPVTDGLADRWRDKLVGEITPDDIHDLVDEVRAKGDSAARTVLLRLNKFFAWCRERRLITTNPCTGVWRPDAGPARERVLSDDEVRWLWQACGDLGEPFGPLVRLILLTGQRKNECAKMTWAEVQGDVWHLPGERAKNGRSHTVPLSRLALEQIHGLHPVGTTYVFSTNGDDPVSGWTKIKQRLDEKMTELARAEKSTIQPWVTHDLRRTVATGLQKLGIKLEVTEAVLNHVSGSRAGIVGVYQRHQYADEKRAALQQWADYVEGLVATKKKPPQRAAVWTA
jgi:integrase